jgi:hypothetical protein
VCVLYYCLCHCIHTSYITRCVCSIIICIIIYIQTKLLQYYYREILNIQTSLRDVQVLGVDNRGPPVSCPSTWNSPSETPNRCPQYDRKRFCTSFIKIRPRFLITLTLSSFLMLNFKRRSCHTLIRKPHVIIKMFSKHLSGVIRHPRDV